MRIQSGSTKIVRQGKGEAVDLISRTPNGRLDSMAACMLLLSGALSFKPGSIDWDGEVHRAQDPTIHDDVISMYQLSHRDVEEVVPDLIDLLNTLERDKLLRVPASEVPDDMLDVLPFAHLTGMTLFLLQEDDHALIIELVNRDTFQVRYDIGLCAVIPDLQELLCRMLCHLRLFRGDREAFSILFKKSETQGRLRHAQHAEDTSRSPIKALDSQVVVGLNELVEVEPFYLPGHTGPDKTTPDFEAVASDGPMDSSVQPDARYRQAIPALEASIYTTHMLASATSDRIKDYEETLKQIEATKPIAKPTKRRSRAVSDLTSDAKAVRSMAIRSALYIGIGIALMWLGRKFVMEGDELLGVLLGIWNEAVGRATDFLSLTLGQTGSVGLRESVALPSESVVGAFRIIGFVIMGLGILFPVVKILRYKRRVDRERAFIHTHMDSVAGLYLKKQLNEETEYAKELGAWAASKSHISNEIQLARGSLAMLRETRKNTHEALDKCQSLVEDGTARQPVSLSAKRSATALMKSINAEYSEKERRERIIAYCDDVTALTAKTLAE